jgi:hypothetical protein
MGKGEGLLDAIKHHPRKFGAWEAARMLGTMDCSSIRTALFTELSSKDPTTKECVLEVLAAQKDPLIIHELEYLFTKPPAYIRQVPSIQKLLLPLPAGNSSPARHAYIPAAEEFIAAMPDIIFPAQNMGAAQQVIADLLQKDLEEQDIRRLHAIFTEYPESLEYSDYRKIKLWSFDGPEGFPTDPYGQQFPGPSTIPHLMSALALTWRMSTSVEHLALAFHRQNIIHPFYDGNGRTNFTFTNILAARQGFPIMRMELSDLPQYYRAANGTPYDLGELFNQFLSRADSP